MSSKVEAEQFDDDDEAISYESSSEEEVVPNIADFTQEDQEEMREMKQKLKRKDGKKSEQLKSVKEELRKGMVSPIPPSSPMDTKEKKNYSVQAWFEERQCLMLVLKARMTLHHMLEIRLKEERWEKGNLTVSEIQSLLSGQAQDADDIDWIAEIQELKRNLIAEIRHNHELENDIGKLDKKISLLIKHRKNIKELLGLDAKKKKKSKKQAVTQVMNLEQKQLDNYSNLFYLLQTEPQYLAKLVTLLRDEDMETFLDTVMLTLFGDGFSPREEFLILSLFKLSIVQELMNTKSVGDFLKADSVVPKMIITYNRRKQGIEYLQQVIAPVLEEVVDMNDLNLELNPKTIYQGMISEEEMKTGSKSNLDRNLDEENILKNPEVQAIIAARCKELTKICERFLHAILDSINKLPYGIRWICKQIQQIAQKQMKSKEDEILKVIGYFVYYRFINLAIVTPDTFKLIDKELTMTVRKNLVVVAKVLQNLFTLNTFMNQGGEKYLTSMNQWISKHHSDITEYFDNIVQVTDPADYLRVDKYNELTLKVKPVIIISMSEIMATHAFLAKNKSAIVKSIQAVSKGDEPLTAILKDLGDPQEVTEDTDREIQLTLVNRFKAVVDEEVNQTNNLYAETKELVISVLKGYTHNPTDEDQDNDLMAILGLAKQFAKENKKKTMYNNIEKIFANVKKLEVAGIVEGGSNYASFLRGVALEVVNRQEIREGQRREIKRLTIALRNLRKHQSYMNDQIDQYNKYLKDVLLHYGPQSKKDKKKMTKPIKFSYKDLSKKGVIVASEVPKMSRRATYFYLSSENPGEFQVKARIGALSVDTVILYLDDLLEKHHANISTLDLDQVVLDVNMTLFLINKLFLKAK